MPFFVSIIFICIYALNRETLGISCKNEQNEDIDWWILYKFPKTDESSETQVSDGSAYAFLTSLESEAWKLSSFSIQDETSIMGKTWKDLKKNENQSTYLFYNDEPPQGFKGSAVGHLKGIVAFDEDSGFWITHSVPKFGILDRYEYPEGGLRYGQSAFCVTYSTSQLDNISIHLLYSNPKIYIHKISTEVFSNPTKTVKTLFSDKPAFIHKQPFVYISTLQSLGQLEIRSFAKDNQLTKELYSDIIAPDLKSSLVCETWQNGKGGKEAPSCQTDYSVTDVESIEVIASDDRGGAHRFPFSSTNDHSKWAISLENGNNWVCFADLNRQVSQEKRGGGALCFWSESVWKQFQASISDSDACSFG